MSVVTRPFIWFYHEFGLKSIQQTGRNAYLIIFSRTCRMLASSTIGLVIALFFAELQFSDANIGLFMTLTLLGDLFLGLLLTLIADRVGRRKILLGGSVLMILTGVMFAVFENFWLLLLAAIVGVISISGGDFGPFRAIEESVMSQLTTPDTRADVLTWYITLSTWGSAVGSWTILDAYHTLFWIYAVMGVVNVALVIPLTEACDADRSAEGYVQVQHEDADDILELEETSPGGVPLSQTPLHIPIRSKTWRTWLSSWVGSISATTRAVMYKLWALLAIDSLADGMVPYSLTNYYLDTTYHPSKATLGDVTSVAYLLGAISSIFAAPLARKIGLVNTMVFTHVPSSAAVLVFPFPNVFWICVALLFVRAGLNNMDQAPRTALIAAVVKPEERTAVMGITSMLRTLAALAGPTLTGLLAGSNNFWIAFVIGGLARLTYDLGLYTLFVNMKLDRYEKSGQPARQQRLSDEEEMTELRRSTDSQRDEADAPQAIKG